MLVFAETITPRLQYIVDFAGSLLGSRRLRVTADLQEFESSAEPRINYSATSLPGNIFWIKPVSLLFEKMIEPRPVTCFTHGQTKAFYKTDGDIPFDIFAATFYLLSRYEEYLPHRKDDYGRYDHENALAFRENFLHIPLVNVWFGELRKSLRLRFPAAGFPEPSFQCIPTYDIDEAYSFRYKDWKRSAGGALKSLLQMDFKQFRLRRKVLNGELPDPYDAFDRMDDLHRPLAFKPLYFFLVAGKNGKYDKNILPAEKAMQSLIRRHAEKYVIGVHPSWQSGDDPALLKQEMEMLEQVTKLRIRSSRQHYIRFTLPGTYRSLVAAGIRDDYSMGYGRINGFRASAATPFYWYDLEKEQTTPLRIHPFCYMEANSFFEQKSAPAEALDEMRRYYKAVKEVNGTLILIWHNTFLGTAERFRGWGEVYSRFLQEVR